MAQIEAFMCRLYKDRTASSLNAVRVRLFLTCNKPEEMPPTTDSAKFHILRAFSQYFIWVNAHIPFIGEESERLISKCFLLKDKKLQPIMSERPMLDEKTIKIVSCNCKTGCKNKMCPCRKVPIPCSILCHARGKNDVPCMNNDIV